MRFAVCQFTSVSIHPDHRQFQGLSWETDSVKSYYVENRLCFGLKCAPYIFDLLSQLVVDMARAKGIERIVNYLDDFAIVESTEEKCRESQSHLIRILRKIGFAVSWAKLESPARKVKFLGIIVDSEQMNLSLPVEKIDRLMKVIGEVEKKGSATKRELERIAGHMAHCSTVIKGGRTFSRRVYDLCSSMPRYASMSLTEELLLDFKWWKEFCSLFNGSANIIPRVFDFRGLYPYYSRAAILKKGFI